MNSYSKEYMANWRKQNKDKIKGYQKKFKEKHGPRILSEEEKEKQKEYMMDYQVANREHLRKMKKLQIANNPKYAASLKLSKKKWRENNKEYSNWYNKKRKANDPIFKLRMYLRTRLYQALKSDKTDSALKLLGCSLEEFKNFITNKFKDGMTWDNHGEWELDHIKPLALFNLIDQEQQNIAFHFTNFQPLWKAENRSKRDNF